MLSRQCWPAAVDPRWHSLLDALRDMRAETTSPHGPICAATTSAAAECQGPGPRARSRQWLGLRVRGQKLALVDMREHMAGMMTLVVTKQSMSTPKTRRKAIWLSAEEPNNSAPKAMAAAARNRRQGETILCGERESGVSCGRHWCGFRGSSAVRHP